MMGENVGGGMREDGEDGEVDESRNGEGLSSNERKERQRSDGYDEVIA